VAIAVGSRSHRARTNGAARSRDGEPPRLSPLRAQLVAPGGDGHAGMVSVPTRARLTRAATGSIVEALEAPLEQYPGDADFTSRRREMVTDWVVEVRANEAVWVKGRASRTTKDELVDRMEEGRHEPCRRR
jgi:hypothetical protein